MARMAVVAGSEEQIRHAMRVFISYSSANKPWNKRIADALRARGLDVWDDERIEVGDPWHASIHHAIDTCQAAVCLISANYLKSTYIRGTEVPAIQAKRASTGMPVIPILMEECAWREAEWLTPTQMCPPDGRTLIRDYVGREDEFFVGIADRILARISGAGSTAISWRAPISVDIRHLRRSGARAIGRERVFDDLDNAFNSPDTHVFSLVGPPGVGKSTVIDAWLERLRRENYRHAVRVYGWSFQPSTSGDSEGSADAFASDFFRWFREDLPIRASPWERGNRLAHLVRQETMLLILDGIEVLQATDTQDPAPIQDPAIARMLTELARDNRGLVLITSRRRIAELEHFKPSVRHEYLDVLSPDAGAEVLKECGLAGERLKELSEAFGNHSLALSLLAGFLQTVPREHVAEPSAAIPPHADTLAPGGHARRVMKAFEARFGDGPVLQTLGAIALFEGPTEPSALANLRRAAIPGLTDHLEALSEDAWSQVVSQLRTQRLVMPSTAHAPDTLDMHPLVRMHFAQRLRSTDERAWRRGHEVLYQHFGKAAPAVAESVDDLKPLYRSVRHGCEAGRHQEVLDEVFWKRILRGQEQFSWRMLGHIQSDLTAISRFFADRQWTELIEDIRPGDAGFVIGQAAIYLGMTGRLRESVPLLRQSVARDTAAAHLANASVTAANLAHVLLLLGDFPASIDAARHSVEYADRSADKVESVISRTELGNALHRASRLDDAEEQFVHAEAIQRETVGQPFLYAGQGLEYGDLLIARGRWSDAQARSVANLARGGGAPGRIPGRDQDVLAAARAGLAGLRARGIGDPGIVREHAESAVAMLRECGQMDLLPLGLLTRADLYRFLYRQHEAHDDIEETLALCERCGMRLYEADALILHAQVFAELGKRSAASESLARATVLNADMGYHAHDAAVATLRLRLADGGSR